MTTAPKKQPEDTAFSIANLVLASNVKRLQEFYAWCSRRQEREFWHARTGSQLYERKALNPFAAEFLVQAIFRRIGVRTVPTQILSFAQARNLSEPHVVKIAEAKEPSVTLHAVFPFRTQRVTPTSYCLVSKVVGDAVTFDFLRRRFGLDQGFNRPYPGLADVAARSSQRLTAGLTSIVLRKECPSADDLYADFDPSPDELRSIRSAMRWNGERFLKICAARAFVACSAPHNANVLVTRSGELVSIDHCTVHYEDGGDLRMLYRHVNHNSPAFGILGEISTTLDEAAVRAAVADVPQHPACGSTDGICDYFLRRLRLWQSLYEAAPSRAVAQAV